MLNTNPLKIGNYLQNFGDSKLFSTPIFQKIKPLLSRKTVDANSLINSLIELDSLIGLESIKESIFKQISYALLLTDDNYRKKNKYMLHTIITGPPGVGKTNLAYIIGKILSSLGIINRKESVDKILNENQEVIHSLSKNIEFIIKKTNLILTLLSNDEEFMEEETEELDFEYNYPYVEENPEEETINMVKELLDWIIKLCKESNDKIKCIMMKQEETIENNSYKFKKVTRTDLIGKWQGHTASKTLNVLEESIGGILFIDEAYQLINSEANSDNFGIECLNVINEFMSSHANEIIIIFAGYEKNMEETIFRVQPGLERRFLWKFNIEPYNSKELTQILIKQVADDGWELTNDIDDKWLISLIGNNKDYFKNYGGDTSRLLFYSILNYAWNNENLKYTLNKQMLEEGLKTLKSNYIDKDKIALSAQIYI